MVEAIYFIETGNTRHDVFRFLVKDEQSDTDDVSRASVWCFDEAMEICKKNLPYKMWEVGHIKSLARLSVHVQDVDNAGKTS